MKDSVTLLIVTKVFPPPLAFWTTNEPAAAGLPFAALEIVTLSI
jgi:hypothetical protein